MSESLPQTALIGYSGFVGSNLLSQRSYSHLFNSQNAGEMAGRNFQTIVCAGVRAVKWMANKDPDSDWADIERLLEPLAAVKAERVILISTIDVYTRPFEVTEDDAPGMENHAYGRHRLRVEAFVKSHFPRVHIVRLPGLFGPGLKKNVIYDLLHNNCLDAIQPESSFQYYDLRHLSRDLDRVVEHDLPLLNIATEPVSTRTIIERFAPEKAIPGNASVPVHYDFRSRHSGLWGGSKGYLYDASTILRDMEAFMHAQRGISSDSKLPPS